MKTTFFTLVFVLLHYLSFATINQIDITSEGETSIEFDSYMNSILNFEDRLFVQSIGKIEEFKINSDGSLKRIHIEELNAQNDAFIEDDCYYSIGSLNNRVFITIFDLTTTPMKRLTELSVDINDFPFPSFFFSNEHIMISHLSTKRTVLINKSTHKIDGYINGLYGANIVKQDSLLVIPSFTNNSDTIFNFYHVKEDSNYEFIKLSEFVINQAITFLTLQDNLLIVSTFTGAVVIDITNIYTPEILYNVQTNTNKYNTYSIHSDGYLYISDYSANLSVFQLKENGEYSLIFTDTGINVNRRNMCIYGDYLYMNKGYGFAVYDISDNFKKIYTHGMFIGDSFFLLAKDDIYFVYFDWFHYENTNRRSFKFDIYSIFSKKIIITIYSDYFKHINNLLLKDNLLFISYTRYYSLDHYFDIYDLSNDNPNLIKSRLVSNLRIDTTYFSDSFVYFNYSNDKTDVYSFNDIDLNYYGTFDGTIPPDFTSSSDNFILNWYNRNVIFRDINDFNNIFMTTNVQNSAGYIAYIDDKHFAINSQYDNQFNIYKYDLSEKNANFFQRITSNEMSTHNGIIIKNASQSNISEYYSIIDGKLTKIGEKQDFKFVEHTFFFFEKKKMVQVAASSISIYDFDYTTVSETDVVAKTQQTALLGNYPNPFNPTTTIKFRIENSELRIVDCHASLAMTETFTLTHSKGEGNSELAMTGSESTTTVKIDIFNIKGQKVRSLVNGNYPPGEHSVIWNGTDDHNTSVTSGVYFYSLTTNNYTETKKMILLK